MTTGKGLPRGAAWEALRRHALELDKLDIAREFAADPHRYRRLSFSAAGLFLDLSKNRFSAGTLDVLARLADDCRLPQRIEALLNGEAVNCTEERAALHTALRESAPRAEVAREQERLAELAAEVHSGRWRGFAGSPISDVVNIGIGGSDLGPRLIADALRYERAPLTRAHFVSNVDGGELNKVLAPLDPRRTLFIVASKSFTTPETLRNATTARQWLLDAGADQTATAKHFVAVSANVAKAAHFGVDARHVFAMWDWVGGRYSVWSAIGLPVILAYGMDVFRRFLAGAAAMDRHFRSAPVRENLPVLLGLSGVWHGTVCGAESHAIIPYDDRLSLLPAYLQQLEMESNGKRVDRAGAELGYATAPVIWGGVGTNAQHAFFQLLHQGTRLIPIDLIVALTHPVSPRAHHDALVANCLAQSEALLLGRPFEQALAETRTSVPDATKATLIARHRQMPGNRPHSLIVMEALTAETLGALLALYEHKTFVQGVIWDINSFDQWGVELGKTLASRIEREFEAASSETHDASTQALIERYRSLRDKPMADAVKTQVTRE
jgi:glucose-6-phosphate isomerase